MAVRVLTGDTLYQFGGVPIVENKMLPPGQVYLVEADLLDIGFALRGNRMERTTRYHVVVHDVPAFKFGLTLAEMKAQLQQHLADLVQQVEERWFGDYRGGHRG